MSEPANIDELLALKGSAFVTTTYRTLLGREPDPHGWHYYIERLSSGASKHSVISEIAGSTEFRTHGLRLPGLQSMLARQHGLKARLLGALLPSTRPAIQRRLDAAVYQVELLMEQVATLRQQLSDGTSATAQRSAGRLSSGAVVPIPGSFRPASSARSAQVFGPTTA